MSLIMFIRSLSFIIVLCSRERKHFFIFFTFTLLFQQRTYFLRLAVTIRAGQYLQVILRFNNNIGIEKLFVEPGSVNQMIIKQDRRLITLLHGSLPD